MTEEDVGPAGRTPSEQLVRAARLVQRGQAYSLAAIPFLGCLFSLVIRRFKY